MDHTGVSHQHTFVQEQIGGTYQNSVSCRNPCALCPRNIWGAIIMSLLGGVGLGVRPISMNPKHFFNLAFLVSMAFVVEQLVLSGPLMLLSCFWASDCVMQELARRADWSSHNRP